MHSIEEKINLLEFYAKREREKAKITGDPFMQAEYHRNADILREAAEDLRSTHNDSA